MSRRERRRAEREAAKPNARRGLIAIAHILDHTMDLLESGALDDLETRSEVIAWNRAAATAALGDSDELHELRVAAGLDRHGGRSDDAPAFLLGDVTLSEAEAALWPLR